MADKDREAHNKGEQDFKRSGGIARDPVTELFHPTYSPPSEGEEKYKEGWDNAKKQSK